MTKLIKNRSKKAGLPPGTLVHIGDKKREEVKITLMNYSETHFEEKEIKNIDECLSSKNKPSVTWINIDGVHQAEILRKFGEVYNIHALILEDILNTDQRPKIEDFGDYLYIVLKMLYINGKNNAIISEQVSLILGPDFVLSFQEGLEGDVFNPVRERIRSGKSRTGKMGADYLAYSLIDSIVDSYFHILESLGEKIESFEEKLVTDPSADLLHNVHALKKEMIFLRKSVWPLRDVISFMERAESALIRKSTIVYLRDIYDHTIQIIDTIETFRDIVSAMLDIYLSSVSYRMNAVMKVLTIIATIFMPLTFLAGLYGMNFRYMPELEWKMGYPLVLAVMLFTSIMMLVFFRKKKWL